MIMSVCYCCPQIVELHHSVKDLLLFSYYFVLQFGEETWIYTGFYVYLLHDIYTFSETRDKHKKQHSNYITSLLQKFTVS
jgi:hypothetical protein